MARVACGVSIGAGCRASHAKTGSTRASRRQRVCAAAPGVRVGGEGVAVGSGETSPLHIDEGAELAIPISKEQAHVVAEAMKQWLRE